MALPIKPLVLAIACLASSAAEAQFLGLGFESNITLTQQDLDMIRQTVNQQIHGKPAGATASWSNPSSQNSGAIKLLKKFTARNMRCEEISYTLRRWLSHRSITYWTAACNGTEAGKFCKRDD